MQIYYAHHLWKYNTEIEKHELALISRCLPGCKILNPNGDIQHADLTDESKIMKVCLQKVSQCDGLVFSSLTGVVGHGVYDEVQQALSLKKPVWYIENNELRLCSGVEFEIIDESRRVYAIVR